MCTEIDQGLARWYLTFGDYASILEPESLKNRVKELLQRIEHNLNCTIQP